VDQLAGRRARVLYKDTAQTLERARSEEGKLLLYYPDANLYDGAAELHSRGYFDVDNAPPWDTWMYYVQDDVCWKEPGEQQRGGDDAPGDTAFSSFLVSWVPQQFVELADAGIWANPERCIIWADAVESAFTRALRRYGLLPALVA
jgi:hypothetical protein